MKGKNKGIDNYSKILVQLNNNESLVTLNQEIEATVTIVKNQKNDINISEEYNENITKIELKKKKIIITI